MNGLAGGNAPSATDAPLGLSARRSTSQGVDNTSGVSPDNVDSAWRIGRPTPWPLTGGNVGTGIPVRNEWFGWQEYPLGDGRFSRPLGQTKHLAEGRQRLRSGPDGDVVDPCDGISGDRTLCPSAGGSAVPHASPGRTDGSADGCDAPLTVAMDVGPVADGHGTTGDDVGGANASSPNANVTPARQLTRLYPLFNGKKRAGSANLVGWERGGRTAQRVSSPPAAVAASPVEAVQAGEGIEGVAVRALNTSRAGGPPGKLPCAPPAPRLHAWFLEPRKRQRLWWSTGTAICQMAVPHHLRRWVRLRFCHGRHSRGDGPSRRQPLQIPRESILQGDDGISGEDPDDVDGDVANPVGDCALGDRPLTLRSG